MIQNLFEEKRFLIAGLKVRIIGKQTVSAIGRLPGFDRFEIGVYRDADVIILTDRKIDPERLARVNPVHSFSVLGTDYNLSSFRDGYFFEMRNRDGRCIVSMIYDTCINEVAMSSCHCEASLKFAVWVAFSFVALNKSIVPIHASAIVKEGSAVLFLGESGMGKSTHSGLWIRYIKNVYLLNDDSPLVRIDGDKVTAHGSPWSGKTHCYRREAAPVKALVRIHRGARNTIGQLGALKSIGAIYPSCPPLFAYDKMLAGKMLGMVDKIVTHTPVYTLNCLPDREAAEVSHNAVYQTI